MKILKSISLTFLVTLFFSVTVGAAMLQQYTTNTYVESNRKASITVSDSLNPFANETEVFSSIGLGVRNVKPGDPLPYVIPQPKN